MTALPALLVLTRAAARLGARVEVLEARLDGPDAETTWPIYLATVETLTAVLRATSPEVTGRLLSTAELAHRLGISVKTVLRRRKSGALEPAQVLGQRGRAALRWRA